MRENVVVFNIETTGVAWYENSCSLLPVITTAIS